MPASTWAVPGQPPANKGRRYPADPPRVEEIHRGHASRGRSTTRSSDPRPDRRPLASRASDRRSPRPLGVRPRARAGLDPRPPRKRRPPPRGRHGRLGRAQLRPWPEFRRGLPVGPLFCVVNPPTAGAPWSSAAVRTQLRQLGAKAGVRRRFAPHQLRHAHAVEMAREGVPMNVIQRQLGHSNLGVTSVYLQGIETAEIVETVRGRRGPVIPAAAALVG
jgi:integrase